MIKSNSTQQLIHDTIVAPAERAKQLPDVGYAYKRAKSVTNRENQGVVSGSINAFFDLLAQIGKDISQILPIGGLLSDEIAVDISVRTPYGMRVLYNVPLHTNNLGPVINTEIIKRLDGGFPVTVKIAYDGGKPSECSAISWRGEEATAYDAVIEQDQKLGTGNLNIGGLNNTGVLGAVTGPIAGAFTPELAALGLASTSIATPGQRFTVLQRDPMAPYCNSINQAGQAFGIDPNFIAAIIDWENRGHPNPKAVSYAGAQGLMQVLPGTFQQQYMAVANRFPAIKPDPTDPYTSIIIGSSYLSLLFNRFGKSYGATAAAYNAGPGALQDALGNNNGVITAPLLSSAVNSLSSQTQDYVPAVIKLWGQYKNQSNYLTSLTTDTYASIRHADTSGASSNTARGVGAGAP